MLVSLSCLIPAAPCPTLDKVIVCTPPDFPSVEKVLENLDVPPNIKDRITNPLRNLLKSLLNDRVTLFFF